MAYRSGVMCFPCWCPWHQSGTRCQSVSGEASCTSSGRHRGLIPGQTHPEKFFAVCSAASLGFCLHDGSLWLIKLSLVFEAGSTVGLTETLTSRVLLDFCNQLDYKDWARVFTRLGVLLLKSFFYFFIGGSKAGTAFTYVYICHHIFTF